MMVINLIWLIKTKKGIIATYTHGYKRESKFSITKIKVYLEDGSFITTLQIKSSNPVESMNARVNL